MSEPRDANGKRLCRNVAREDAGWGSTVHFGHRPATEIRRYIYATRAQARQGNISDDISRRGRIA